MQTACSENINQLSNTPTIDIGVFGLRLINLTSTHGPINTETRSSHSTSFNSSMCQLSPNKVSFCLHDSSSILTLPSAGRGTVKL